MTVEHIVLFKFKKEVTPNEIQSCFEQLYQLAQDLPEIKTYQSFCYESNEGMNQNYTHGFIMQFDSAKDRDTYLDHPKHLVVKDFITPKLEENNFPVVNSIGVIAFDFNKRHLIHNYKKEKIKVMFDNDSTENIFKINYFSMPEFNAYTFYATSPFDRI